MSIDESSAPELPSEQNGPPRNGPPQGDPTEFSFANAVDWLCQLAGRTDALAHVTEDLHDRILWNDDDDEEDSRRHREHLAVMISDTAEAARDVSEACRVIADEIAKHRPGV